MENRTIERRMIDEKKVLTGKFLKPKIDEWFDLAKLVVVEDLMNNKNFISGREMVLRRGINNYRQELKDLYEHYSVYRYFNDLPYEDQKQVLHSLVIVNGYLKNNPEWLHSKFVEIYKPKIAMIMTVALIESELDFGLITDGVRRFALDKNKSEITSEAFYVYIAKMVSDAGLEEDIHYEVSKSEGAQMANFFKYDRRVLLEQNPHLLTNEIVEKAQKVYAELSYGGKWKFKEKKTVYDIFNEIREWVDVEIYDQMITKGIIDFQELYRLNGDTNKLSLIEWVALIEMYNLNGEINIGKEEVIGLLSALKTMVDQREKVKARQKLFENEVDEIVRDNEEYIKRENQKVEEKARKQNKAVDVVSKQEEELKIKLQQMQNELNMVKNNIRLMENEKRELVKKLKEMQGPAEENGEAIEVAEFPIMVEEKLEYDFSQIELPKKVAIITGHPNLRKKVKAKLGWEVIDIDKHFELGRVSRADLIVYNSKSNNHRAFKSLQPDDIEKLVYVDGKTNIGLILKLAKEEYCKKILNK